MNTTQVASDLMDYALMRERLEADESRAAQLEEANDDMQSYINAIRVTLHTEKDELTIDAVRRVISERDELRGVVASLELQQAEADRFAPELKRQIDKLTAERDEARRKLAEEQALFTTAVNVIKSWNGDETWGLYLNNAPEMKAIRAALLERTAPVDWREAKP